MSDPTPPVINGERSGAASDDEDSGAELAYIPCRTVRDGDQEAYLELRPLEDGRLAMLAYSSLDHLIAGCGEVQPWVAIPRHHVSEYENQSGSDVVVWDTELPEELRHNNEEE